MRFTFLCVAIVSCLIMVLGHEPKPRWDETCDYITDTKTYYEVEAYRTSHHATFIYEGKQVQLTDGNYQMECEIV